MSFITLSEIQEELPNLTKVSEQQYNDTVEHSLKAECDFLFVDCHEYGEAYYIDGTLAAFHEIECIGQATHYLLPHIIL